MTAIHRFVLRVRSAGALWLPLSALLLFSVAGLVQAANAPDEIAVACDCELSGVVHDAVTSRPIGWADVLVEELNQAVVTDPDGTFHFWKLPSGSWTLRVMRVGYRDALRRITIAEGDTLRLNIGLSHAVVELEEVEFKAKRDDGSFVHDPAITMEGQEFERELGLTVAESVDEEPGIAQRSMGPAPARPVLRGLGGDRLLMLEDGQQTGDLSGTSSDHAVAIEPMTARRIEVIRGPETLLYSSGALGGVVNVERGMVQSIRPSRTSGAVTVSGETVSDAAALGGNLVSPLGEEWALRLDGSGRTAGDMNTPEGRLKNTSVKTWNGSAGLSWLPAWGFAGVAGSHYSSDYGIPGGFVGAHPNGVNIEMERQHIEGKAGVALGLGLLQRLELNADYSRYYHAEYGWGNVLGMEFGVTTTSMETRLLFGGDDVLRRGAVGVTVQSRDYKTGGLSFTPNSLERSGGAFLFEEYHLDGWTLRGALRGDFRLVRPYEERTSVVIGQISDRDFYGVSGAAGAKRLLRPGLTAGVNFLGSWRAPTLEELYSEGPHLAAYSYEIGNPKLDAERGIGTEIFMKFRATKVEANLATYLNQFDGYIFPLNTGQFAARRADLYEYRFTGVPARFYGVEGSMRIELSRHWDLNLSGSHVVTEQTDTHQPLPMIPPTTGHAGFDHHLGNWTLTFDAIGAARQDRTGEFEAPTSAWLRFDFGVQSQFVYAGMLHSLSLVLVNATDTDYRQHLSRIKVIMPEPGRNLKLVLRTHF